MCFEQRLSIQFTFDVTIVPRSVGITSFAMTFNRSVLTNETVIRQRRIRSKNLLQNRARAVCQ